MRRPHQTSAEENLQKLRTNKIKRNWYLGQEQILYIRLFAQRFGISQAECLRRLIRIVMTFPEDFINSRVGKI